jgi:geranylgeranyl diphosphate synthase type II
MDPKSVLLAYKKTIDEEIEKSASDFGVKTSLRDACIYALLNGGKRFRPSIVLMLGEALNSPVDITQAALAIEYFHCASLVADDLPCMDDDDERRNRPSVHRVYGEAVALLVSYALIAAGYQQIKKGADILRESGLPIASEADSICVEALGNATHNTGIMGATGGQHLDLFPPSLDKETLLEALFKKTVSLFEISFVLGWLYAGGDRSKIDRVKELSYHFGMAFQIADDIDDLLQDSEKEHQMNIAAVLGKDAAIEAVYNHIDSYQVLLKELKIASPQLQSLTAMILKSFKTPEKALQS